MRKLLLALFLAALLPAANSQAASSVAGSWPTGTYPLTDGATITVPCPGQAGASGTNYLTLTGNNHQILFPSCPASSNGLSVKFKINAGSTPFTGLTFASGFNWTGGSPYAVCTAGPPSPAPNPACPAAEIANQEDWFGCDVVGTTSPSTYWACWAPQYNVGPPVSIPALGSSATAALNSGASASVTLSTTASHGVLVLVGIVAPATSSITVSSTTLGAWTQRVNTLETNQLVEFTAPFTSTLTSEVVTLTLGGGNTCSGACAIDVFEIENAPTSSYFDVNSGLPVVGSVDPLTLSTSQGPDFVFAFFRTGVTASPTAGSGWTLIAGANYQMVEYQITTTPQSGLSATMATGAGNANGAIGDAIR